MKEEYILWKILNHLQITSTTQPFNLSTLYPTEEKMTDFSTFSKERFAKMLANRGYIFPLLVISLTFVVLYWHLACK